MTHRCPDGIVRLALAGEPDLATAPVLQKQVERTLAQDRPRGLVLDLADLTFCDSTGIGALIDARAAALNDGASLQVTNPNGATALTLQIVGVHEILTQQTPV